MLNVMDIIIDIFQHQIVVSLENKYSTALSIIDKLLGVW